MDNKKHFNSNLTSCLQCLDSNKVTERKVTAYDVSFIKYNMDIISTYIELNFTI